MVFHFLAKETGAFKFVMENDVYFQSKQITFTVGVRGSTKTQLHGGKQIPEFQSTIVFAAISKVWYT